MKPIEFLRAIAATMPGKPSPSRSAAMGQFAVKLEGEFRGAPFTHAWADAVAKWIGGDFPTWGMLAEAMRGTQPEQAPAYATHRDWSSQPAPTDPEAEDRDWWNERLAGWTASPPYVELTNLHGAMIALTGRNPMQRGRCHPRPMLVARVLARIAELEAEGHQPAELVRYAAGYGQRAGDDPAHRATVTTRPVLETTTNRERLLTGEHLTKARAAAGVPPAKAKVAA